MLVVARRVACRAGLVGHRRDRRAPEDLNEQLASHEELLAERERLRAARATLLGESPTGQISQEDIAVYLAEHPGFAGGGDRESARGIPGAGVGASVSSEDNEVREPR